LNIALIGCGFIGATHSHALRALRRAGYIEDEVVSTWDTDPVRAQRFAEAHPGARAASDLADALDGADVAWVCTPTSSHLEVVGEVVGRGLALFCEKPLAPDLSQAEELAAAVGRAAVPNQVGLVLRHAPVFRTLRQTLEKGGTGPVMAAVFRDDQFFPIQGQYASTWRADASVAGGGALIEHSIHDLDLVEWLLGEVVSLTASSANHAGHPGIEDVMSVQLTHASGAVTSLVTLWHEVLARPSTRRLEVFCRDAVLWLEEDQTGPLHVERSEDQATLGPPPEFTALADSLPVPPDWQVPLAVYASADLAFLDSLRSGRAPAPSVGEALRAHRLVDAAYRSAASGSSRVEVMGNLREDGD
jgi:UDP-N-acetyl-2-amino-2-deoxyglucuronate dehydrogenase